MNLKNYSNDYVIIVKKPDELEWNTDIDCIETPTTFLYAISTSCGIDNIKKIIWDFGTGNQLKSITNRKQDLNMFSISCKYKKAHDTTVTISASVYTDNDIHYIEPIETVTVNHVIKEHYVHPEEFKDQILEFYKTGVFSDEVAMSIYKIANRLAFASNFINYCVDEETEALTQRGWLKYNEINRNDTILSYNIETKKLIWSHMDEIYVNEKYDGYMHKLTNQGIDALVTPGHKFITLERGLVEIENIKAKEHLILMGDPLEENKIKKYSDDFVALVGWAVTEGNYLKGKKTHALQIFQKEGPKANMIRKCLHNLDIKYKEYIWSNSEIKGFRFNKDCANIIINEIAPDKILSYDFILDLTYDQRMLLLDVMLKGDGWIIDKNNTSTFGYTQKDKKHIDSFLMLCALCGKTVSYRKVINKTPFGISKYYNVYFYNNIKKSCSMEHTDLHGGRPKPGGDLTKGKKPNIPTQKYKGVVWCPKTEYGNFMCRRGQYIYLTGNTYREEMVGDAVVRMVDALISKKFDPDKGNPFSYFTKIAFHAFCNRIKKEKKMREALTNYQIEVYSEMRNEGMLPSGNDNTDDYDNSFD